MSSSSLLPPFSRLVIIIFFLSCSRSFIGMMRRRKLSTSLLVLFLVTVLAALYFIHLSSNSVTGKEVQLFPDNLMAGSKDRDSLINHAIREQVKELGHRNRRVSSIQDKIDSVAVLLPSWEVLVVVVVSTENKPASRSDNNFYCLFPNNATSLAKFYGVLPFSNAMAFKCVLPRSNRRRSPFYQPVLTRSPGSESPALPARELPRWSFLVYDSVSTEDDVVLFVKGVNKRQGFNRSPEEFRCVFGDDLKTTVKTPITSSVQEVFRCSHPNLKRLGGERIKVSLEISGELNRQIPSVAYYTPRRKVAPPNPKKLLCACTMVYNSAKFLREWVMYHSEIGVEKFLLYDNGSTDDLPKIVDELNQEGYNVEKMLWIWPKTQEAGFSHGAVYAKDSCVWMMYFDVDEFVCSPSWLNSSNPSKNMLNSLLPRNPDLNRPLIGQISIKCNDFGPSGRKTHPPDGVTQGYTCRRQVEQRHKSVVLLEAVDRSLLNVVHHFGLNQSLYRTVELSLKAAVMNHYKYQAWPEFKNKFRQRVSAYVVDWTKAVNPTSQDRTPGLGFEAIEPQGWAQRFCEVRDERLKKLTQRWFGSNTPNGYKLAWER
ncbi:hypothetical protein SLE2022_122620 [Rubroshorea leprosula]